MTMACKITSLRTAREGGTACCWTFNYLKGFNGRFPTRRNHFFLSVEENRTLMALFYCIVQGSIREKNLKIYIYIYIYMYV